MQKQPRSVTKIQTDSRGLRLKALVEGLVISPEEPGYEASRKAWNLSVDQHPALILFPESAADIAAAIRFARQAGLKIAVQATGHGNVRPADGSLLINTASLQAVRVDPKASTAWIQAGAKWGKVLEKTQPYGLAPLLGSSPDVGAIGYTLGGGMGWLARKHGLAVDSVEHFELVTADGQLRRASATESSDLFWGLRGGGGSLGVITAMQVRLYPVTTVYGGNLFYPIEMAREVFARYREFIQAAPLEFTSSIVLINFPSIPEVPDFLQGQSFVVVRGCYCGPVADGEALLKPWQDWQTPLLDEFRAMSFSEVATISNEPVEPVPGLNSGAWLRDLSDETTEILLRFAAPRDRRSPLTVVEVRHAGGAISQVNPETAAYGHRDAALILQLIGLTPSPEAHSQLMAYNQRLLAALKPHLTGKVYINFLEGQESRDRIKDAYEVDSYRRLATLKARYDPENLFSHSFNITPSGSSA